MIHSTSVTLAPAWGRNELETNNLVTISLDLEHVNSSQTPTLFIARTIIHEAIHANLYLALYKYLPPVENKLELYHIALLKCN